MKVVHIDDVALLRGINSRNKRMVDTFYKRVYPKLYLVASRYMDDEHDAQSVVADVFLDYLKEEKEYENLEHIEYLLYKRVRWAGLDRLKALKKDQKDTVTTDLDEVSATEDSVEEDIVKAEFANLIREALEALPPRYRMVLEECFFEGKQSPDIARLLNVTDGTLYTIKARAIKRLQAIFADKNIVIILLLFFPPD